MPHSAGGSITGSFDHSVRRLRRLLPYHAKPDPVALSNVPQVGFLRMLSSRKSIAANEFRVEPGGRDDRAGVPYSPLVLAVLAQRRGWLHPVLTVQDRVQEQIVDTGLGTLAKTSFDSLAESIYTLSDEGNDQFVYARWPGSTRTICD
jgi:hypothetical protein